MTAIVGVPFELELYPGGVSPAATNFTLNQTTDQWEIIFQAVDAITITRLGFRQGTVTGTPPVYIISLQGVDASGNPDGTIKGGASPASVTFTPAGADNSTWLWKTLANAYTCARGEWLSIVITYSSGSVDSSNNCSFTITSAVSRTPGQPYGIQNDNGVRARQAATCCFGYGSSGTAYGQPTESTINSGFSSGTTPDEKATLLNIPSAWWNTYKIVGVVLYGTFAVSASYTVNLYDTDGSTVLQNVTVDTDSDASAASSRQRTIYFDETTLSTLNAGSSYRLSVVPGATSLTIGGMTMHASADLDAWPGGSAVAQGSTRKSAGAWTDDNKTRYGINPILADITAPTGGGGGLLLNSGMLGGLRG